MDLAASKILVTGADGFIGSHLVETLVEQGHTVKAFVYYNSFNSWGWLDSLPAQVLDSLEVISGDIRDSFSVQQAMQGCDVVLHLAALIAIPYSYQAPEAYVDTNVKGTLNVLHAARHHGVKKFIHTSTSECYGSAQFVPITEEHPLVGQSPYSASKIAADQMAIAYQRSFDLPVTIVRPFNTYGPRQSARAVIPTVITQIAAGCEQIKLGALHPTRDFNFIEDTVAGFIAAAQSEQGIGEVINLGSQYEISIGDTVALISELMGKNVEIQCDEQRIRPDNSEVERLFASNEKAKQLLNWSPNYADRQGFAKGLAVTIDWFSNPDNLKHYKIDQYNV